MTLSLSAAQMKACDGNTIHLFHIPSVVLMERAALAVCDAVSERERLHPTDKTVRIYAGPGNNGADALACARMLTERGFLAETLLLGAEARHTEEYLLQKSILDACGGQTKVYPAAEPPASHPAYVIDGLFGVGLGRELSGEYAAAVREINALHEAGAYVAAVDMPSGVHTDTGGILGCAVQADITVTFGFRKTGQLLYPGAGCVGGLVAADIGIREESLRAGETEIVPQAFCYAGRREVSLKKRAAAGNKGSFGKVLVIAGSAEIGGAAVLASEAVLRSGAGMVRVLTHAANRDALLHALPEALMDTYADGEEEALSSLVRKGLDFADAVVCGCGIGRGEQAERMLHALLREGRKPLVLDADALNLLAEGKEELLAGVRAYPAPLVLTPHLAEFARLYTGVMKKNLEVKEASLGLHAYPKELADALSCTVLCKDARSVCADARHPSFYINLSGTDGMATAGTGDVLAGFLGTLLAQEEDAFFAACAGAFLHGLAGERAAEKKGRYGMTAGDLLRELPFVLEDSAGDED